MRNIPIKDRHKLVLSLLSSHYKCRVDYKNFKRDSYNKPYIDSCTGKVESFSYAHTKQYLVMLAGKDGAVGVDVEDITKPRKGLHLLKDVFSKEEHSFINRLDSVRFKEEILKIWVQKEAIGKALGVGIMYDMASVTVSELSHGCFKKVLVHDKAVYTGFLRLKECCVGLAWHGNEGK